MNADLEALHIINSKNIAGLNNISDESLNIIKEKINKVPASFFAPRIIVNEEAGTKISLIEFSMQTIGMGSDKRKYLMDKYHVDPYDMDKLQGIIDSINVARNYGTISNKENEKDNEKEREEDSSYGFALASEDKLDKAYPLWLAYIYANSSNPFQDVKNRLINDGMIDKYKPEYIVGLIEHTNELMNGKSEDEKKEFYMNSINGILSEEHEMNIKQDMEI